MSTTTRNQTGFYCVNNYLILGKNFKSVFMVSYIDKYFRVTGKQRANNKLEQLSKSLTLDSNCWPNMSQTTNSPRTKMFATNW